MTSRVFRFFCTNLGTESNKRTDLELEKFLEDHFESVDKSAPAVLDSDMLSLVSSEQQSHFSEEQQEINFFNRLNGEGEEDDEAVTYAVDMDHMLVLRKRLTKKRC